MKRFGGYDPGGNGTHGVARFDVSATGVITNISCTTCFTANDVVSFFSTSPVDALGIDTLTEWNLDAGGWRPADQCLRQQYAPVRNSVMTPNRLSGSMCLSGVGVAMQLRHANETLHISETHPKVLCFALTQQKYDWSNSSAQMVRWLSLAMAASTPPVSNEHEFDALLSAWACLQGVSGRWTRDLHALAGPIPNVKPLGQTRFYWP